MLPKILPCHLINDINGDYYMNISINIIIKKSSCIFVNKFPRAKDVNMAMPLALRYD